MKLYIRECRRIATSIIFYLFIAILVFSWFQNFRGVTKTEIDWANGISPANIGFERALLSEPSSDDEYFGSKTSEDNPEAIMTGVTRALLAEYESNSYATSIATLMIRHNTLRGYEIIQEGFETICMNRLLLVGLSIMFVILSVCVLGQKRKGRINATNIYGKCFGYIQNKFWVKPAK